MARTIFYPILFSTVLCWSFISAPAQSSRPAPTPPPPPAVSDDKPEHPDFGADPGDDLRARLAIKADQKQHEETLARAREISELGSQLLEAYKTNKNIAGEDNKKLDRLEKLVKKIRNDAGGLNSEDDVKETPNTLEAGMKQLADWTDELCKDVEKTPRHVISAVVIDRANDLIGLIQHLRKLVH
jgi:hypothetical protein